MTASSAKSYQTQAANDASDAITMLIARAPEMIAAGITSLTIEGLATVTLAAPAPAPLPLPKAQAIAKQHIDPLRDASTYPSGRIPGYTRDEDKDPHGGRRTHE